MEVPYLGPTVVEAAEARLWSIRLQLRQLHDDKRWAERRLEKFRGSKMLEAERIATEAEVFQRKPLTT